MEELLQDERELGRKEGREEGLEEGREEGLEKGREEGLEKGREEGLEKGREEGLDRMSSLMKLLKENGRMDDMQRSWSDKKLLNQLFKEYNI